VIYMRHPVHGTKVAIAEAEAVYDETHGWNRYTPGEVPSGDMPAPVNTLAPQRRARRMLKEEMTSHDDSRGSD
jgi:hypothetical protein